MVQLKHIKHLVQKIVKVLGKEKVTSSVTSQKNFSYKLNDVTLSFSLSTDKKDNLETFKELLESAITDVEETLLSIYETN